MKSNQLKKILVLLTLSINTSNATRTVTVDLESYYDKDKSNLNEAIECYNQGKKPKQSEKVLDLTPTEAKEFLYDYAQKRITDEKSNLDNFFTGDFFGLTPRDPNLPESIEDIINNDSTALRFVIEDLYDSYNGFTDSSGDTDEDAINDRDKLSIKTLMVPPKQLYEALKKHKKFSKMMKPFIDFEKFKTIYSTDTGDLNYLKHYRISNNPDQEHISLLKNKFGCFTHDLVKNIVNYARNLMISSQPGDTFVIFGNTPYFVGRALRHLCSNDQTSTNYRRIINFPFSGSPNGKRPGNAKVQRLAENTIANKNLVTPERHKHLMKRLDAAGLLEPNSQTFHFVDVVITGQGIAYVIKQIICHSQDPLLKPKFHIFNMEILNFLTKHNIMEHEKESLEVKHTNPLYYSSNEKPVYSKEVVLTFPSVDEPDFNIPATFISTSKLVFRLGHPPHSWRVFPDYNPCYWQDEYDYLRTNGPSEEIKILLRWFDLHVSDSLNCQDNSKSDTLINSPTCVDNHDEWF